MRHLVNSRLFLLRKKLDNFLYRLMPNTWVPLYTMVSCLFALVLYKTSAYEFCVIQSELRQEAFVWRHCSEQQKKNTTFFARVQPVKSLCFLKRSMQSCMEARTRPFDGVFMSLQQVSFTRIRYHEAWERRQWQNKVSPVQPVS